MPSAPPSWKVLRHVDFPDLRAGRHVVAGVAALVRGAVALAELEAGHGLGSGRLGGPEASWAAWPRSSASWRRRRTPERAPGGTAVGAVVAGGWSPATPSRTRRGDGAQARCGPGRGGGHRCRSCSGSRNGAGRVRGADSDGDLGRGAASAAGASARRLRAAGTGAAADSRRGARRPRDGPRRRCRRPGDRVRGRAALREDAAAAPRPQPSSQRTMPETVIGRPAVRPSREAGAS